VDPRTELNRQPKKRIVRSWPHFPSYYGTYTTPKHWCWLKYRLNILIYFEKNGHNSSSKKCLEENRNQPFCGGKWTAEENGTQLIFGGR